MFDADARVWQDKALPLPCLVSISIAFPNLARTASPADKLPLWLRTGGVHLEDVMEAELLGWLRLNTGQWLGRVKIRPQIGRGIASMTLWVTADAIAAWPAPLLEGAARQVRETLAPRPT